MKARVIDYRMIRPDGRLLWEAWEREDMPRPLPLPTSPPITPPWIYQLREPGGQWVTVDQQDNENDDAPSDGIYLAAARANVLKDVEIMTVPLPESMIADAAERWATDPRNRAAIDAARAPLLAELERLRAPGRRPMFWCEGGEAIQVTDPAAFFAARLQTLHAKIEVGSRRGAAGSHEEHREAPSNP